MATKKWIKDYLYFSKRDRLGILALLFLIGIINILPFLIPSRKSPSPQATLLLRATIDSLNLRPEVKNRSQSYHPKKDEPLTTGEVFDFDPNTASEADWKRMGLKEKTIQTIGHYRDRGGK